MFVKVSRQRIDNLFYIYRKLKLVYNIEVRTMVILREQVVNVKERVCVEFTDFW